MAVVPNSSSGVVETIFVPSRLPPVSDKKGKTFEQVVRLFTDELRGFFFRHQAKRIAVGSLMQLIDDHKRLWYEIDKVCQELGITYRFDPEERLMLISYPQPQAA